MAGRGEQELPNTKCSATGAEDGMIERGPMDLRETLLNVICLYVLDDDGDARVTTSF